MVKTHKNMRLDFRGGPSWKSRHNFFLSLDLRGLGVNLIHTKSDFKPTLGYVRLG